MAEPLVTLRHARLTLRTGGGQEQLVLGTEQAGLHFTLSRGEHTLILGRNGAGKSTLLRLLRGELWMDPPASGQAAPASLHWHTAQGAENSPLAGREMAALVSTGQQEQYMRQGWDMRGEDMLATGFADSPLLYTAPEAAQRRIVRELAEDLGISGLLTRAINTLSQGQLRILLLARALVRHPALLLLDEYVDGLDADARCKVLTVLEKAAQQSTIVMTAHRADSVPPWVRRRLVLEKGLLREEHAVKIETPMPRVAVAPCASVDKNAPPLVDIRHATVYIDREPVLHDINWTWRQGEHWRIHGGNGAGKSTLLRLLAGDEYPALGGSIARHLPRQGGTVTDLPSIRRGVRLVSDRLQACYAYDLTGLEFTLSGFDNVVGLYRTNSEEEEQEALHWLRFLGLTLLAGRRISTLSTGQLRQLLLARALVGKPDMVLLDEPCSGLDAHARRNFWSLLHSLSAEGIHLALVSHHSSDHIPVFTSSACIEEGHLRVMDL